MSTNTRHTNNGTNSALPTIQDYRSAAHRPDRIEGGSRAREGLQRPVIPLFSIITVVRNGARTLEGTIQSVLAQSIGGLEYIIIDGGSTDGTLDIIRKYDDRIDLWVSEPDNGIYDAMNKGIAQSTGRLIGILNSDDCYEKDSLSSIAGLHHAQVLDRNTVIYGDQVIIDEDLGIRTVLPGHEKYWQGMTICHQAMFVTRDVYEEKGLYDASLRFAADYDFFIRSVLRGVRFVHLPIIVVSFSNAGATYNNVLRSNAEALQIHRNYFGVFSKNYLYFFFYQFLRGLFVTAVRRALMRIFSKKQVAAVKLLYNKFAQRASQKP
jgi:glycosyltransferase involved in cell wall biosynthesis